MFLIDKFNYFVRNCNAEGVKKNSRDNFTCHKFAKSPDDE